MNAEETESEDVQNVINVVEGLIQRAQDRLKGYQKSVDELRKTLPNHVVSPPLSNEWEHLGVTDAAVRWILEYGPSKTREIAEGIRDRGVRSQSKKFSQVVYATLKGAKRNGEKVFQRISESNGDQLWGLTEPAKGKR